MSSTRPEITVQAFASTEKKTLPGVVMFGAPQLLSHPHGGPAPRPRHPLPQCPRKGARRRQGSMCLPELERTNRAHVARFQPFQP